MVYTFFVRIVVRRIVEPRETFQVCKWHHCFSTNKLERRSLGCTHCFLAWRWRLGAVSVLKARWRRMAAPHHHKRFCGVETLLIWTPWCHGSVTRMKGEWFQHLSQGTRVHKPSWKSVSSHKLQCAFQNKIPPCSLFSKIECFIVCGPPPAYQKLRRCASLLHQMCRAPAQRSWLDTYTKTQLSQTNLRK